jgi:predicted ATPase/class 3 adenylate cyclase/DNA-binding CsgD family transcriptional regulator
MDGATSFGRWLRQRRRLLDLTQEELAQRVGCSVVTIRKFEADERRPSKQIATRLADALDIPPTDRPAFLHAARADLGAALLSALTPPPVLPARDAAPRPLPSGTVTFLFTDVEGSTQLWERHAQAMGAAIARHEALLRDTITTAGGVIFKMVGDAVCAAFESARDALTAAMAGQRALAAEGWTIPDPLQVRMVLHTGVVEERGGDYAGLPLSRVARLLSAGHGGQILLSLATEELVREHLPPDVTLRDLGSHRLKDLSLPEHIFQLVTADLPAEFPPLKSLNTRSHNLPAQPTPLIDRTSEVEIIWQRLRHSDMRLLTLSGTGGIGKTRLALQVAAELVDEFEDGVFSVPLAPIRDPGLVATTIAQTLRIKDVAGRSVAEILQDFLSNKHLLLLLDNFEHVMEAASLVTELLATAPRLKVLITSREMLNLYGEHLFEVPPLALPDLKRLPPVEALSEYAAVELFTKRSQAVKPNFALTQENARAAVEICVRLDGLPLAIELAAARSRLYPPQTLLEQLGSRLKLLTGGPRDVPTRQQTLRGAISWSYDLLSAGEQTLFRRLAVFVGGCRLAAAETVCNGQTLQGLNVMDGILSLVNKTLLQQEAEADGTPRFAMLETLREYALDCLAASGELEAVRQRHAACFLALAEEAEPKLTGPEQKQWLDRLETEHDNLRAALGWLEESRAVEAGWQLGGALWRFWSMRGYLREGRERLAALLALAGEELPSERCMAARAKALKAAGTLAAEQGDYVAAHARYEESLAIRRELGDKLEIANLLSNQGIVARYQGNYAAARALYEESLAIRRELGDRWGIATSLNALGLLAHYQGDNAAARRFLGESLTIRRELGDAWAIANSLSSLGDVVLDQGDYATARALLRESLAINQELGDRWAIAYVLEEFAGLAAVQGQPARSLRLAGAAAALREAIGSPRSPIDQAQLEHKLAPARQALGEATAAATWAEGQAMQLAQAVAYALAEAAEHVVAAPPVASVTDTPAPVPDRKPRRAYPAGLTVREVEVLRLVAQGLTYTQIAQRLVISPRTVNHHLTAIYSKLGVTSRHNAVRFAIDHDLV